MKKKILFVSIIAALLMVSMPFVSTLQATYVQPQSTSVTKTTTTSDINLNQQQVISMLQLAKSKIVTPSDKAFCQQMISSVYLYSMNLDCLLALGVFSVMAGIALGVSGYNLWNELIEGNIDINTLLEQLDGTGFAIGYFALLFWLYIVKPRCNIGTVAYSQASQSISLQPSSSAQPVQSSTCPFCAK
jgi:hypothetical protein